MNKSSKSSIGDESHCQDSRSSKASMNRSSKCSIGDCGTFRGHQSSQSGMDDHLFASNMNKSDSDSPSLSGAGEGDGRTPSDQEELNDLKDAVLNHLLDIAKKPKSNPPVHPDQDFPLPSGRSGFGEVLVIPWYRETHLKHAVLLRIVEQLFRLETEQLRLRSSKHSAHGAARHQHKASKLSVMSVPEYKNSRRSSRASKQKGPQRPIRAGKQEGSSGVHGGSSGHSQQNLRNSQRSRDKVVYISELYQKADYQLDKHGFDLKAFQTIFSSAGIEVETLPYVPSTDGQLFNKYPVIFMMYPNFWRCTELVKHYDQIF